VWDYYLENGKEITVLTDHESLKYMRTIKRPSKRLLRWIEEFQAWNLNIKYPQGSLAIVPDALSRRPDYFDGDLTKQISEGVHIASLL
jgi:RNase H-like domain found in reverse transcriptase